MSEGWLNTLPLSRFVSPGGWDEDISSSIQGMRSTLLFVVRESDCGATGRHDNLFLPIHTKVKR